jgi:hypothetical protein
VEQLLSDGKARCEHLNLVPDAMVSERLLSRYEYDGRLHKLILRCPSIIHDTCTETLGNIFVAAMASQDARASSLYNWNSSTSLTCQVEEPNSRGRPLRHPFIADFSIYKKPNIPMLIVEVAFTQTREKAMEKIRWRLANIDELVAAIVINLVETPPYRGPTRSSVPKDYISEADWDAVAQAAPYGPIVFDGLAWIGSIVCSIDVIIKCDPNSLEVRQVVRSVHDSM